MTHGTYSQTFHLPRTQLLYDVLDKDPQPTNVVIDEIDTDNWGVCDETVPQLRLVGRRN